MFNILDFIDSKDIREYNRNTQFTPIEQAFLICYSRKTTIEEKLEAWHELLDTYSEEDFELTHFGNLKFNGDFGKSNKQILMDTVTLCENALLMQGSPDGLLFEAVYYKGDDAKCAVSTVQFSNYHDAFVYLKQTHQEQEKEWREFYQHYLDEKELPNGSAVAKIVVRPFGKNGWYNTTFYFDNDMRLTTIDPTHETFSEGWCNVAYLFVYIPIPFQKGDIVRLTRLTDTKYGVIPETPNEAYYRDLLSQIRDSKTLPLEMQYITLDTYDPGNGEMGTFDCHGYNPLEFELCPEDELPDEQRNLLLLRAAYLDQIPVGQVMRWYSLLGKEAYQEC